MTYLPSLFQRIDRFFQATSTFPLIKKAQTTYTMPDEPEEIEPENPSDAAHDPLYDQIVKKVSNFDNQEIGDEVLLIGDLFQKAVEINGGFDYVSNMVGMAKLAIADFDMGLPHDDEEADMAESLLDQLGERLDRLDKTGIARQMDRPSAIKILRQVQQTFKDKQSTEIAPEQKSVLETHSPGEAGEKPENMGFGLEGPQERINLTRQKYEDEIKNLTQYLESGKSITKLIEAKLGQIIHLDQAILNTLQDISNAEQNDDKEELSKLRTQSLPILTSTRSKLVRDRDIRLLLGQMKVDKWNNEALATDDPKEKYWLRLHGELAKARMTEMQNKTPLIKALKGAINALGENVYRDDSGTYEVKFVSRPVFPEQLQALQEGIQKGWDQLISKEKYDSIQSKQRAKSHGLIGNMQERRKGRRGGGLSRAKLNRYNIGDATFEGLVDKMGERINTTIHVVRLSMTQIVQANKQKCHNELKPYVDNVSKAIQAIINTNNSAQARQAKYDAIRELKVKIVEWKNTQGAAALKPLEKNIRLLPFFKTYEAELAKIATWKKNGVWDLDEAKRQQIKTLLHKFDDLIRITSTYYGGKEQVDINFSSAIKYISTVLNVLEYETGLYASNNEEKEQVRVEAPTPEPIAPAEEPAYQAELITEEGEVLHERLSEGQINYLKREGRKMSVIGYDDKMQPIWRVYLIAADVEPEQQQEEALQQMQKRLSMQMRKHKLQKLAQGVAYAS